MKLGFSSIAQYSERYFGYQHSQTYDCLRVAKALRELKVAGEAFDRGEVSWTALKEITKVATRATEKE